MGQEDIMKETPKRLPVADQIRNGLEEAVRHAKGEITFKATTLELPDRPPEVRAEDVTRIRLNNQMSQNVFARLLNVSPKTVQSWEHGTRRPSQAALRLIQLLEQNPQRRLLRRRHVPAAAKPLDEAEKHGFSKERTAFPA
jgi:putative transcriptional regulator